MIKLKNDRDCCIFLFGLLELVIGLSYSIGFGGFLIGTALCTFAIALVKPPG